MEMNKYQKLTDKELFKVWDNFKPRNELDRFLFRNELVKRGFVSWEEINIKYELVKVK